jgi:hypothetical protein
MKLANLAEAKYHIDPREQFLKNYFVLDDEDADIEVVYQMWYPKKDIMVTAEWSEGGGEHDLQIVRVVSMKVLVDDNGDPKKDPKWEEAIFPEDWDDPLPDEYELQHLDVWKKVT